MPNYLNDLDSGTMISIQNLTKRFGTETLLENINLVLHPGEKIALVGPNGSGKTTLLRCLVGHENHEGRILVGDDAKISLMEQEKIFDKIDKSFNDYLKDKKQGVEDEAKFLEAQMGTPEIYDDEDKFNATMDRYNLLVADASLNLEERRTLGILKELGVDEEIRSQKVSELSGGQKVKLRLAECISKKADLYLLDEPTNHLDLETREWLEEYIEKDIKSLIVISHDEYFLKKTVDKVLEIEDKSLRTYNGNYENFVEAQRKHHEALKEKHRSTTKEKKRLLDSAEEKMRWAHENRSKTLKIFAEKLRRNADNIEVVPDPEDFVKNIALDFPSKKLHNCEVFRLNEVSKEFDGKILFEDVTLNIENGEKIAILGGNGSGKTTLLKMLMGIEKTSSGKIAGRENIKIGYFDQGLEGIDRDQEVATFLEKELGRNREQLVSVLLSFGFTKEDFIKKIGKLSGGEKARLNLLRISFAKSEILLLDEPTNNLDAKLRDALKDAVKNFPGTVIVISHDRDFINGMATRTLDIEDKRIVSHRGNYEDWLRG